MLPQAGRLRTPQRVAVLCFVLSLLCCALPARGAAGLAPIQSVPGATPVGQSLAVDVTLTAAVAGSSTSVEVLTSGAPNLDYQLFDPGTCLNTALAVGQTCHVTVQFSPLYPGRRDGAVRLRGTNAQVLAEGLITAQASGSLPVLRPGRVDTVAGNYGWTYSNDGVLGIVATIFTPKASIVDGSGNLFISDTGNNRIRRVDARTGLISTYAGNGIPAFSGDNGPATTASISGPAGLALDGAGNLYFSDYQNSVVRRVDAATGIITTVAGTPLDPGTGLDLNSVGDNGSALAAHLRLPESLAFDAAGNLFIADSGDNLIRKVSATTGIITTIAGTFRAEYNGDGMAATAASLYDPSGVFCAADGSTLIADTANNRVRRIATDGTISTIAGNGGQTPTPTPVLATQATLNGPTNVAMDAAGNVYFTDSGANRLQMIDAVTKNLQTLSGNDSEAYFGDTGPADQATYYGPYGLAVVPNGDLLLTDMFHMRVRRISATALPLTYPVMRVGKISSPKPVGLVNAGNATLTLHTPTLQQSARDTATTTCGSTLPSLAPAVSCNIGVEFAPTSVGNPITGSFTVTSDALATAPVISLSGQVLDVNPTTIRLSLVAPSTNPSMVGDAVVLRGQVTSDDQGRTGTVDFSVDGSVVCNAVTLAADGTATCSVAGLQAGSHPVVAVYSGDAQNASATSDPFTQVVKQRTNLVLTTSDVRAIVTKPVQFTLTASTTGSVPTGSVTFLDGGTTFGTAVLNAQGVAQLTTSTLALGAHTITAQYQGDATNASGTSQAVAQLILQGVTSTSVGTSNASVPVGTSVVFQATVSSLSGLSPTGSVAFRNGNVTLGTASLLSDGSATLTLANLAAGTYSVVAVYSGDADNATSSSTPLTQLSNKLPTLTSMSTDAAPLSAGNTLHLSAKVVLAPGASAFGTISGTIAFADGGAVLASVPVAADGTATFAAAGLSVGTHTLTATYNGDANYGTSAGTYTQSVVQTASTIVVTPGTSAVLAGKEARFVANVSSNTGVPTGIAVFKDAGVVVGSAPLTKGVAIFSSTSLAVGQHTLTATYTGDANYMPATSDPVTLQVRLAHTSLVLTGPSADVVVTNAANFAAALSTEGVTPTGTVTLLEAGMVLATQKVAPNATFSFSLPTLTVGSHIIVATYSGDANNDVSTSPAVTVQVDKAASTTALASSLNPAVLGSNVAFTATVTSAVAGLSGTVDLLDNGQPIASSQVTNGLAVFTLNTLSFGSHTLTARYAGDGQHGGSTSSPIAEAILQAASVALTSTANPAISGQPITLTAAVPGAAGLMPTGTIVFSNGATILGTVALNSGGVASLQIATLPVGTQSLLATYAGDASFAAAKGSLVQLINLATTQIGLSVSANPATFGNVTDVTARVQSVGSTATGSIAFVEAGTVLGSAVLDGSGVAVLHTSGLAPGAHSIAATYAGDGKASPSTSAAVAFLVKQQTSLSVQADANPSLSLSRVALTATLHNSGAAPASGTVAFFDAGSPIGSAPLAANGTAVLTTAPLATGLHAITASYQGDDANFAATAPVLTETVKLRDTSTTLTASATSLNDPQQVTLIAVVQSPTPNSTGPTGTVTFFNGPNAIGTIALSSSGVATFTTRLELKQTASYSASYGGDSNYAPSSASGTAYEGGTSAQFSLTASSTNITVARAQHTLVTITAASIKGFSDDLKLGCVGLPYAATCTFTTMQGTVNTGMTLAANGSGTMQLTIDTGNPLGGGGEATTQARLLTKHGAYLCLLPAVALLWGMRRGRRALPSLLALLACMIGLGLSGCGGLQVNSTPAGSYTFQVTAVGQHSGVTQSQTVTLTVTQ